QLVARSSGDAPMPNRLVARMRPVELEAVAKGEDLVQPVIELIADEDVLERTPLEARATEERLDRHERLAVEAERDSAVVGRLLPRVGEIERQIRAVADDPREGRRHGDALELDQVSERVRARVCDVDAIEKPLRLIERPG